VHGLYLPCTAMAALLSSAPYCAVCRNRPMLLRAVAASALEWACLLNLALMCIHWAPEILATPGGREVGKALVFPEGCQHIVTWSNRNCTAGSMSCFRTQGLPVLRLWLLRGQHRVLCHVVVVLP
jgi:hypothetical protein